MADSMKYKGGIIMLKTNKVYGNLNDYIGLHRVLIYGSSDEINISKSSNGGYHLFLTSNKGFSYGYGLDALKMAITDFELLQDKTIEERKQFIFKILEENIKEELNSW